MPIVAKRKPASSVSGEQSDRQLSAGASRPCGLWLAVSTDADSAVCGSVVVGSGMPATASNGVTIAVRTDGTALHAGRLG
jgi:hypothetical protein